MPGGIQYGATAATKWTNTSLTSKEMFFLFRYSIQTVVYLGTKLLGGSQESLDAANPFQRTLYSLPPGVPGSRLARQDPLGGEVVVLTLVVRVHIAGRELEGDRTSAGVRCSGTKLGMVAVQDLVIPHTNRIHILPDLPHDYPRHIPRRLPMPGQEIVVVLLHPYGVLESIFLDLALFSCSS